MLLLLNNLFLLVLGSVCNLLLIGQWTILEWNDECTVLCVPMYLVYYGEEKTLVPFDIVDFYIGILQFKLDSYAIRSLPGVISKMFGGFNVILVMVGPVEVDFLAIVGDSVALFPGVAPLGDEIAVLVVSAEEGIEVIVDGGFQGFAGLSVSGFGASFLVFPSNLGVLKLRC